MHRRQHQSTSVADVATLKNVTKPTGGPPGFPDAQFQQVFAAFEPYQKADPSIAEMVLPTPTSGTATCGWSARCRGQSCPVMLWRIPQGHISSSLDGRDLPDTTSAVGLRPGRCAVSGLRRSSFGFFGDSFTATGGTVRATLSADLAR